MNDQSLTEVEMSDLAQMEAFLAGAEEAEQDEENEGEQDEHEAEDSNKEEEQEEGAEEEGAEEEEPTEESGPEDKPAEETEELIWNGEVKKVTKAEYKELAHKGFDYTQKTQQLAEERRTAEARNKAEREEIALEKDQIEALVSVKAIDAQLDQYKAINWQQLEEQDPLRYLQLKQSFRDLKDKWQEEVNKFEHKAQALQQLSAQRRQELLVRESKALLAIPEFVGAKGVETKEKITSFLREEGYSDEEIGSLIDHRAVKVAWKAAQWDALKKSSAHVSKKVAEVPKVIKTGSNKPQERKASKDTFANLKKTGRGEYAARLIEQML